MVNPSRPTRSEVAAPEHPAATTLVMGAVQLSFPSIM
jgi:hypothetical protein